MDRWAVRQIRIWARAHHPLPEQPRRSTAHPPISPSAAWKKGAPPDSGPGLRVDPPIPDLTGDPLADLDSLEAVAERIRTTYCCQTLCPNRTNAAPGEGNPNARLMLIGEGRGPPKMRPAGRSWDRRGSC